MYGIWTSDVLQQSHLWCYTFSTVNFFSLALKKGILFCKTPYSPLEKSREVNITLGTANMNLKNYFTKQHQWGQSIQLLAVNCFRTFHWIICKGRSKQKIIKHYHVIHVLKSRSAYTPNVKNIVNTLTWIIKPCKKTIVKNTNAQ